MILPKILGHEIFPNLQQVYVPLYPIDQNGNPFLEKGPLQKWKNDRENLIKSEIFKDGKVKLETIQPGQTREFQQFSFGL